MHLALLLQPLMRLFLAMCFLLILKVALMLLCKAMDLTMYSYCQLLILLFPVLVT